MLFPIYGSGCGAFSGPGPVFSTPESPAGSEPSRSAQPWPWPRSKRLSPSVASAWSPSRQQPQQLIRAGRVRLGGQNFRQAGMEVASGAGVQTLTPGPRLSPGEAEKLIAAPGGPFPLQVEGRICLDGGIPPVASPTAAFQHGASKVVRGVDVGYGQTAWSCAQTTGGSEEPHLTLTGHLHSEPALWSWRISGDLALADLSFISLAWYYLP